MSRTLNRTHKAFVSTLLVVIVLAFLPARLLGWTSDLARIINVPLMPFRDLGTSVAGWLSPERDVRIREFEGEQHLLQEYEELDRRYIAAQMQIAELEEQLAQIQQIPMTELDVPIRPVSARITARNPRDRTANVQINRGGQHRVEQGTIAVYRGVHLIGKVTSVDRMSSMLLPVTNQEHGPLRAVITPPDASSTPVTDATEITLEPLGDGTFLAEPQADIPVGRGDIVRLAAMPDWPRSSMGMVIGTVESVSNGQSLRKRVIVQPSYEANQIASVVLKVEDHRQEGHTP